MTQPAPPPRTLPAIDPDNRAYWTRGRGGARQVQGSPQVCATSTAGGPLAGAMLLVRD